MCCRCQICIFFATLTILRKVFIGRLKVSDILLAGAFFGLLDGVCTAQHLMNIPMKMRNMMPINTQRYQFSITYCFNVCSVSLFKSKFLSLTKGPSASTARHLRNTSQYPWKLSHGAPGRKLIPSLGSPYRCPNSLVERHVNGSFPS